MRRTVVLIIMLLALLPSIVFCQTRRDPSIRSAKYELTKIDGSTTAFACDSLGNDSTATYRAWPNMSLMVNTTSSGTVAYNLLFQEAAPTESQGCGDVSNWVTAKTTAISATGNEAVIVTEAAIPNFPCYRVFLDGQATNDPSTAMSLIFNGAHPGRKP